LLTGAQRRAENSRRPYVYITAAGRERFSRAPGICESRARL